MIDPVTIPYIVQDTTWRYMRARRDGAVDWVTKRANATVFKTHGQHPNNLYFPPGHRALTVLDD